MAGIGLNHIDEVCKEKGIEVFNVKDRVLILLQNWH